MVCHSKSLILSAPFEKVSVEPLNHYILAQRREKRTKKENPVKERIFENIKISNFCKSLLSSAFFQIFETESLLSVCIFLSGQ